MSGVDAPVSVVVETDHGEVSKIGHLTTKETAEVRIETKDAPRRVVVDKYNLAAKANGGAFTVLTFDAEPEQTLIVYGTDGEANVNREAADALQQAIRARWSNVTVPIIADRDVTDGEMKTRHLLLIGRPPFNRVTARFRPELPITFGTGSFVVRGEAFAHPDSAVIVAAENPLNPALFRRGDRGPRRRRHAADGPAADGFIAAGRRGGGVSTRKARPFADVAGQRLDPRGRDQRRKEGQGGSVRRLEVLSR